jgi:hypothetical protein
MDTLTHHAPHWRRAFLVLGLILALISLVAPAPVHSEGTLAATRKLSTIIATEGAVKEARIADDRIIYLGNFDAQERYDLYSAPLAGGAITRLTADLPAAEIDTYVITPAGRVVFTARHTANGLRYLYSVAATGSALALLGPAYPANPPRFAGSQLIFGLAGELVVFAVDATTPNGFELYSVPAAGGSALRLSPELPPVTGITYPAPFWVTAFAIDDGAGLHVAMNVHQGPVPEGSGLYAAPADGSTPPMLIGGRVDKFDLAPDGQHVVYTRGDELRIVSFTGGGDTLIDSGWAIPFAVTPDSAPLVYALQGEYPAGAAIKVAPIAGGPAMTVAENVRYAAALTFQLTPDSAGVLYNDQEYTALLLAPILGGAPRTVIDMPATPFTTFTPDGSRAIFAAGASGTPAIYSYPLVGGQATRIDDPAASAGGLLIFDGVIAGDRVIYAVRAASSDAMRLYSVPAVGGASTPLTGDLGPGQELIFVRGAAADGTVVFTTGSPLQPWQMRWRWLYAVPADGSAVARLVNIPNNALRLFLPLLHR